MTASRVRLWLRDRLVGYYNGTAWTLSWPPRRVRVSGDDVCIILTRRRAEDLRSFIHAGLGEEVDPDRAETASLTSSAIRTAFAVGVGSVDGELLRGF